MRILVILLVVFLLVLLVGCGRPHPATAVDKSLTNLGEDTNIKVESQLDCETLGNCPDEETNTTAS